MAGIRIATFNLYQFAAPPMAWYDPDNTYKPADWEQKQAWIKAQLALMDADIVGFQEIFSTDEMRTLLAEAGYPHVAMVDDPGIDDDDDKVFVRPVVGLASRSPISAIEPVAMPPAVKAGLRLPDDAGFSRPPVRAVVETEAFGDVVALVAHLKSKRPAADPPAFGQDDGWDTKVRESMRAISLGHIASLLQRGAEATALYHAATEEIAHDPDRPVVVLGDLNDDDESVALAAATMQDRLYEIAGVDYGDLPDEAKRLTYRNRLYDSFNLAPNQTGGPRPPTHFHRGHGSTLDYVLVSNAVNPRNPGAVGFVTSHEVYGDHLRADGVGDDKQSDHAQVVAEISRR